LNDQKSAAAKLKGLYAITDPALLPDDKLLSGVESALSGGASIIQYRDKTASEAQRLRDAENLRSITQQFGALLLINDDIELCCRVEADGVHLGKNDGDIGAARARLGANKVLGVTCHRDIDYARHVIDLGVDYCAFGRLFSSRTKPEAPHCPVELLSEAARLSCPTLAIGGITTDNFAALLNRGIDMIAVIHGLFGQDDIEATARSLSRPCLRSDNTHSKSTRVLNT